MPRKRKKQQSQRHKASGLPALRAAVCKRWRKMRRCLPKWALWVGGISMVALYVWGFYYFFVSPYGFRWKALFGEVSYPAGYDIHGIDVSHYQGDIDWELLRNQGSIDDCPIRFVFIKATEGSNTVDSKFKYNFQQARQYGLTRGAYHFYSVHSTASDQARFFISQVKLEEGDLPPVLDVERKSDTQSTSDFQRDVLTWLRTVEGHYGVKPILYTYYKFKMEYLNDTLFNDYPYWIAHYYVDSVRYEGRWKFWQHTDVGHLPGIKGYVDFNVYNGSFYDLQQMTVK